MTHSVYIVDVFAERRYAGNPLAVVLLGDEPLSDETMQQIAAETNYSETTFVTPTSDAHGAYTVRLFTPAREIDFAGHPILGTAWVIRHHLLAQAPASVCLNLAVGPVTVRFEPGADGAETLWFGAPPMTLGATCDPALMAQALGIARDDIDPTLPVQRVAAGTAAMIVPLRSLDALRRSQLDLAAYAPLAAQGLPPLTYLFCRETLDPANDLTARFFFEAHGVREDPATGNGAAFLGAYLLAHAGTPGGLSLRIEQGHALNRPSLVRLRASLADGAPRIQVGGGVIAVLRGELL